jgi:hypothetical protein
LVWLWVGVVMGRFGYGLVWLWVGLVMGWVGLVMGWFWSSPVQFNSIQFSPVQFSLVGIPHSLRRMF